MGSMLASFALAALLVVVPIILQMSGHGQWWLIAGGIVLALILVVAQPMLQKTLRYRITNYRIDFQRGLLTRQIDSLELWYVDHINFRQSILERMLGVGTIELTTDDERMPHLVMRSIPNGLQVFEHLKTSALAAKRQRGLIEFDPRSDGGAA
jgi:uncharacterized membrane protein YdbT with pleckstrin-like domain